MERKWITAYALIYYDCNEHRFKEQNLKGHGENVVKPLSNTGFVYFLGCVVSTISGLLPQSLGFSDKKNRHIGFGHSKEYQH
jgi:hypothetical protein